MYNLAQKMSSDSLANAKVSFQSESEVQPRYLADVLSRGQARFALCFLLNEVGDVSFLFLV